MKILKHGNVLVPIRGVCNECHCVFLYDKTDMKQYESYLPKQVKCPECNMTVEYEVPISKWEF